MYLRNCSDRACRSSCQQVPGAVAEIRIGKVTGDKTGLLIASSNTRIYVETHSIRTQAPVNYQVNSGGQIVFPVITVLRGSRTYALSVSGEIHGVEELRISSNVGVLVTEQGSSSCFQCHGIYSTQYVGHYWFKKVQIMLGGNLKVQSSSQDILAKSVWLHASKVALEYTGSITADTVNVFADYLSLEFDASADSRYLGWSTMRGPGSHTDCEGVGGAGHGGPGGGGQITGCSPCHSNGGTFWTFFLNKKLTLAICAPVVVVIIRCECTS